MFRKIENGETIYFEKFNDSDLNIKNVLHIIDKYTVVTFNGIKFDLPVIEAAVSGYDNKSIHKACSMIIEEKLQPWEIRKQMGFPAIKCNHIDLIEVAPIRASLKIYGGRIHCPKMKDLPLPPDSIIKESDLEEMRMYCRNDLEVTGLLFKNLEKEIELRDSMGEGYGIDLRSKSDAQMAEGVIKSEMIENYGLTPKRPKVEVGTEYYFKCPDNIQFESEQLKNILRQYTELPFIVGKSGHVEFNFEITASDAFKSGKRIGELPDSKKKLQFTIGNTKYTVGTGGLHSCEKSTRHTNENHILREYDVAAYYPNIILNNRLYPKHLGVPFLEIYGGIVRRRLKAKAKGDKITNESLKITINGSFGKFGSKWSFLYSPDLMMQVTVTGQLTLLMLIERLEAIGVNVVSANTDGIVVKMDHSLESKAEEIISDWEFETDYEMEGNDYISLNSRDVNNYIAIKENEIKGKGAYSDQREHFYSLRSNPANDICTEAVKIFLKEGTPPADTIYKCKDITKFITVRTVNGGAVYHDNLLGKAIRWYYGRHELDVIRYNTNGNKVPRSDGAVPIMDLPDKLPSDIDYDWYVGESQKILKEIGYN